MFGRHGEAPVPIVAAMTPAHCFDAAIEAVRIALKYRTPSSSCPTATSPTAPSRGAFPDVEDLPDISTQFATEPNVTLPNGEAAFWPYVRDPETLGRALGDPWHARPRAPDRRAREGRPDGQRLLRAGEPRADGPPRAAKIAGIAKDIPPVEVDDPTGTPRLLRLGWGSTYAAITAGVRRVRRARGTSPRRTSSTSTPSRPTSARC